MPRRSNSLGPTQQLDDAKKNYDRVPAGHRPPGYCRSRIYWRCFLKALRLTSKARSIDIAISVSWPFWNAVATTSRWRAMRFSQSPMRRSLGLTPHGASASPSSSASRFTAGASGFLNLSQSLHLPLR
jgi:hypothetical protein